MLERTVRALHSKERDGQTPELRTMLIMHELGEIANRLMRCHRTPELASAYMADIGLEIGHLAVQVDMLALDLGLSPEECKRLGIDTTWERFDEFWGKK